MKDIKLLNIQEASELLGVAHSTIRRQMIPDGLRYFKFKTEYRFRREWLEEYIENKSQVEMPTQQEKIFSKYNFKHKKVSGNENRVY